MVQFDRNRLAELCEEYGVHRLRVFGSVARGEERPDSDVDLIADFSRRTGYFGVIRLERELAEVFGRSVDLVTEGGLSPYMRDDILASSRVIFDASE